MRNRIRVLVMAIMFAMASIMISGGGTAHAAPCGYSRDPAAGIAYWKNCHPYLNNYVHVRRRLWPDSYPCLTPGQHNIGWAQGHVGDVTGADLVYEGCPA